MKSPSAPDPPPPPRPLPPTPPGYAAMLADMSRPHFPLPVGVIRRVTAPVFDVGVREQVEQVKAERGPGDLAAALASGHTWTV